MATKVQVISYDDADEAAIVAAGATLEGYGCASADNVYHSTGIIQSVGEYYAYGILDMAADFHNYGIWDGETCYTAGTFSNGNYEAEGIIDGDNYYANGIFDGETRSPTGIWDGSTFSFVTDLAVTDVKDGKTWNDGDGPHEGTLSGETSHTFAG
jgi:hypothetical protein